MNDDPHKKRKQARIAALQKSLNDNVQRGKQRKKKKKRKTKRPWWLRLLRATIILALVGVVMAIVGYWGLVLYYEKSLPDIFEPEDYIKQTAQVTRVYSRQGDVLATIGDEIRTVVPADAIPDTVKHAVLAAEDADFYDHAGLDYIGMMRAFYTNIRDQKIRQGASTITQQVAKTFYLTSERTISRKLKEVVLARKLEQKLSKDEILFLYLNQIYWGHGRYGVAEAARYYFGKDLQSLTVSDAALLAGIISAPERYSPFRDLEKATQRRAFVLKQMAANGFIDEELAEKTMHEPIRLNFQGEPHLGLGAHGVDMVKGQLRKQFEKKQIRQGGLQVFTTIDTRMQREGEMAIRRGLERLDASYKLSSPIDHVRKRDLTRYGKRLRKEIKGNKIRSGQVVLGVVRAVDTVAEAYQIDVGLGRLPMPFTQVERYSAEGQVLSEVYTVGDVLRVSPRFTVKESSSNNPDNSLNLDQGLQGALIGIDPRTRAVRAIVGGYDHRSHPFNRAALAKRQAGSTIKPIIFAAGLETGAIKRNSTMINQPESYPTGRGRYWKPRNFSNRYDGKPYTMEQALAKSINVIAVKVLERTKIEPARKYAKKVGIHSPIERDLSIALGSTAVAPMEIANAYATFASGGLFQKPVLLTRVTDSRGNTLYQDPGQSVRVTSAETSYDISHMLKSVVETGTGKRARLPGRPAAGKTGTTQNGMDSWFVGYTPELATAVWIGFDDRRPVRKATGGKLAAPIWSRFMSSALRGLPVSWFKGPNGQKPVGARPQPTKKEPKEAVDAAHPKSKPKADSKPLRPMDLLYD